MATESIQVTALIPASPERIYEAWLDSAQHAAMTGGPATIDPVIGGDHTAWGDYIRGKTLELDPGRRIVQSWRSLEFSDDAGDSKIVVTLSAEGDETRITIDHTEIPEQQGERYLKGWDEHYFAPMRTYFGAPPTQKAPETAAKKKAPAKKAAAKKAAAKKAAAKKGAAKKTAAKKAAPKKSAPKKSAAKKAPAKKAVAKKSAAKKGAAKKAPAKKAAKKGAAKKAPAKKAAAKKAAPKPASTPAA